MGFLKYLEWKGRTEDRLSNVLYAEDQFEIEICGVYLNRHLYDTAACRHILNG